jgi:hypothetical protein
MLDRQKGYLIIECDACGEVYEGDADDFQTFIAEAKREGWRMEPVGNGWMHTCPGCCLAREPGPRS